MKMESISDVIVSSSIIELVVSSFDFDDQVGCGNTKCSASGTCDDLGL